MSPPTIICLLALGFAIASYFILVREPRGN